MESVATREERVGEAPQVNELGNLTLRDNQLRTAFYGAISVVEFVG